MDTPLFFGPVLRSLLVRRRSLAQWRRVMRAAWLVVLTMRAPSALVLGALSLGVSLVGAGMIAQSLGALLSGVGVLLVGGGACIGVMLQREKREWRELALMPSEYWQASHLFDPPLLHRRKMLTLSLLLEEEWDVLWIVADTRAGYALEALEISLQCVREMSPKEREVLLTLSENFEGELNELVEASKALAV